MQKFKIPSLAQLEQREVLLYSVGATDLFKDYLVF